MENNTPASIYSIVEKAYYRLQAGDVLTHCLEASSTEPIHEMIQEMVLAGPQSLEALREILSEAMKRKAQISDDLNQVINQLSIILKGYGISLERQGGNQALQILTEDELLEMLDEQKIFESDERSACLQVLRDSQDLITLLNVKIQLLENIIIYLQDWIWGLTYQFIKQGEDEGDENSIKNDVL